MTPDMAHMTAYLGGPMRNYPLSNFPAFDEAAKLLRSEGWVIKSPAEHDRECGFDGANATAYSDDDMRELMLWDLEQVAESGSLILLPGWENSVGCRVEVAMAQFLGKRIWLYDETQTFAVRWLGPSTPTPDAGEVRVVNPTTGGAKGQKLARFDLIPAGPLYALARHYGVGASKYEDRNWERGYDWSLSFGALMRHAWAFWSGEDMDPESTEPSPHLAAVLFHAMALMEFANTHPELDDRPKSKELTCN